MAYVTEYDFTQAVTSSFTLYAKMVKTTDDEKYADNDAVMAAAFTADTTLTVQTVQSFDVTLMPADAELGTFYCNGTPITGETKITVDDNTTLADLNLTFETAAGTAYHMSGLTLSYADSTPSADVYNAQFADTKINKSVTLTPIVESTEFTLTYTDDGESTTPLFSEGVTGSDDTVTYNKDVKFTISPDANDTSVYSVYYSVDNGVSSQSLTPSSGVYTIDGGTITGNVTITVTAKKYYTVTFQQGTGNTMSAITGYAWDNLSGIYKAIPNNEAVPDLYTAAEITNGLTADSGYRLAADTADESLWNDGSSDYVTANIIGSMTFTGNTTFTANSVKTYVVTFASGGNGTVDTASLTVDTGKTFTVPTVTPDSNYSFKEWQIGGTSYTNAELAAYTVTDDVTVTAIFEPSKYSVTFTASDYGTFNVISGITDDYGTYLTPIEFSFDSSENVECVYYTVDGGEKIALYESSGTYTIDGNDVKGSIVIYYESDDTAVYTFASSDTAQGIVSGITGFVLKLGEYLTQAQLDSVTLTPSIGYRFKEWQISDDDVASGGAVYVPTAVAAERDLTFKAMFELDDFEVIDANNAANILSGVDGTIAHMGTDIEFTIADGYVVSYVAYKIGNNEEVKLAADSEGVFTIPGDAITDDVAIITTVVMNEDKEGDGAKSAFEFILHESYLGDNIAAANGRKILILEADMLASGNYALTDYGDFYYSDKYGAYIIWVNSDETEATLNGKMTTSSNEPVVIDYSGDINGTGIVTAGDAGMINDILKNQWTNPITDAQLFSLDVERTEGYQQIMTSDVVWTLKESIGLND